MIVKHNDVINKLPQQYQPYIQAMKSNTIGDCQRVDNLKAIYTYMVEAIALTGSQMVSDSSALKFISEQLYDELFLKYRTIRHAEIRLAFRKGALKELGEYFGFNVQTFYGWIKKYYELDELKRAKLEWNRILDESSGVKKLDVPVGALEVSKENVLSLFKDFKNGSQLPSYARVYYDAILKIKGIKTLIDDPEIRVKIKDQVMKEYSDDLGRKGIRLKEPDKYNLLMNSFDKDSKTFESLSKRLALKYYFEQCIKEGKDAIE